jgi:hypothetical protein
MSRVAFVLAAASLAATIASPVFAAEPVMNAFGIPIAPRGGNVSIHQWGGVDDQFAVNPDGDAAPAPAAQPMSPANGADDEADADSNNQGGDPGTDHSDEILLI